MTHRSETATALVIGFLREALVGGALGVPELEVMARAAGLLGGDQRITHAKVFKQAKKSLGIRSIRNGFGFRGEWLWLLEHQHVGSVSEPLAQPSAGSATIGDTNADVQKGVVPKDDPEPQPADSGERRIPPSWIDGIASLDYQRPFTDIPPHRWRQFLDDCNNFVASDKNWAARASELGWDAVALFGCSRRQPLMHLGSAGLLWAINGGRLLELHRDWAVIELAANGSRRTFHRRRVDAAKVTLPWTEGCRRSGDK